MTTFRVEFHPDAAAEARAAREWYHERSPEAGRAFIDELTKAIDSIAEAPLRWPESAQGVRRFLLRRFPFLIVYRVAGPVVQVIAVAHGRRKPGYWKAR